ncbi:MAG TPA: VIT and VWA domain-containing protein [Pyrinomonadaceae bacterium]|nr:VIT and VWA domain-containing protein [Pyrinomonadaceae bacterium]
MQLKSFSVFLCLLFVGFVSVIGASAQGVIVPIVCDVRPCMPRPVPPRPLPNALPVKSISLDTKINGQVATTHVEQVFRNDTPYTLEGTYFFPIPDNAAIVEFAIWENGKKLVGEVRSREEARRIYDEIVRKQRDPGLLEYAGKDLFQASIFPIPPNSDKKLELTYSQVLKAESGTVSYRYPLGTGRRAWVDAREESGGARPGPKVGVFSGRVEIESKQALRNIYSPSHSIDTKRQGETKAVLSFESYDKNDQNDFQLFYGISDKDFGLSLVTYREAAKDGYFLLTLSPKDAISDKELVNKDIVFVLDTSGSMADAGKMEKARSALLFGIKSLRDGDRFNVINFAGEEHLMENTLIAAGPTGKSRGEEFVKKLHPTGGTNINDSLIAAMKQFDSSSRPKMLVFMTDGLPTVGETNADKIVQNLRDKKVEGVRVFTFGVGYDVNTILLDKIAAENGGAADYVEPKEDLEVRVSNFFSKVSSPVLTDIEIDFGGVNTDLIYPRKMPDLFKGTQITLIGRYQNSMSNVTLRLKGKQGSETRTFTYENLNFPGRDEDNTFLPRLWATRRVGWLVEQIRTNGEQKELRDEIMELGTRYGIVTPYTSYLATDGSEKKAFANVMVDQSSPGFTMSRRSAANAPSAKPDASGAGAVKASKDAREQQALITIDGADDEVTKTGTVKKTGAKTFYQESGVWVDSEFQEQLKLPEVKLKFASDEYFNLLKQERELAQYFALGEQVVVVWKGKIYRVEK